MNYFLKRSLKSIFRLAVTFLIIIGISFIPSIFQYDNKFHSDANFSNYFGNLTNYIGNMFGGDLGHWGTRNRPITADIFYYYQTTVETFVPGLLLGVLFAILAAYLTFMLKRKWRGVTQFFSFFLIALPDFFVIITLQFIIIMIYKQTGIKVLNIATGGTSKAVFLPIFTLSLFPFIYVYRLTINSFENVLTNRYVQTAYAKGLSKERVLFSHVIKNGLIVTLNNLPSIIMPTISNLFIIEYLFNTHGITSIVMMKRLDINLEVLTVSSFLIWFLVEAILLTNDFILKYLDRHRGENYA